MKRALMALAAAAVILGVGWSALWFVAAGKVETTMDRLLAREAAAGRVWTCPDRKVDGFPKQIQVTCVGPTFAGRMGEQTVAGRLGTVIALARLWQPNDVTFDLQGPLVIERGDRRAEVVWSVARVALRGLPTFERGSFIAEDVRLDVAGAPPPSAERIELHLRKAPRVAGDGVVEHAGDLALRVMGGAWAPLDLVLRAGGPVEIEAQARAARAGALMAQGPLATRLEAWRAANGQLDVSKFIARRGPARIDGTAILALDETHRLAGQADLTATGLQDALKALGVPAGAVDLGGALGALLGRKPAEAPAQAGAAKSIPLPLRFERGAIFLGPLRLPIALQPLY